MATTWKYSGSTVNGNIPDKTIGTMRTARCAIQDLFVEVAKVYDGKIAGVITWLVTRKVYIFPSFNDDRTKWEIEFVFPLVPERYGEKIIGYIRHVKQQIPQKIRATD